MWAKYITLLIACVGLVTSSASEYDVSDINPSPLYQIPCMTFGGLCLNAEECPEGKGLGKGLCPLDDGRDCCDTEPKSALCRSQGGECVPFKCPDFLQYAKATDCEEGTRCCIMVH